MHHPIKNLISKSSRLNSSEKIEPKPCNGNRKGNARSKVNSVCSYPNPSSNFGNSKIGSSPPAIKEVESKSVSTITSESGEQQHRKLLNVSSQIVSRTSGLLSSEMGSSNIKRRREKLLEEARESVPEPGFGRVMHLVKAFEKLFMIPMDSDQRDEKQSDDVGDDDDDDKKGLKWALPGLQQPKVPETLVSSSSFCLSDFFMTLKSLGLDSHVSSSLDGSHGSFTISNRTSGGGHRSRRNSSESSGTFGGSRWNKKQLKATYQKPFKLRTEQRGRYKEEESVKKLQQMMMEEEKQRIPIAQGLPWTIDEPKCLVKLAINEITSLVDLVLHSDVRLVERAEFDQHGGQGKTVKVKFRSEPMSWAYVCLGLSPCGPRPVMPGFQVDEALHHTQRAKVSYTTTTQEDHLWHLKNSGNATPTFAKIKTSNLSFVSDG
ncbi:hypothetical protein HYC85_011533 [Camellia sinensis]|uniref:Calmodulin-binding domain-containing protein n=1 Tax=Camellia sinensis TaxID=4442 RepID=A0A7J7H9B7_CAMSI|nr:hypothetical protein HYC85_011533 [Camellia sinensis]